MASMGETDNVNGSGHEKKWSYFYTEKTVLEMKVRNLT